MRYGEIFLHLRAAFIAKKYGDKIMADLAEDPVYALGNYAVEVELPQILKIFQRIDATKNQKYIQWIVNQCIKGHFFLEDEVQIRNILKNFDEKKQFLPVKDINQYKHLSDLEDALNELGPNKKSKRQEKLSTRHKGADVFYGEPDCTIIKLKNKEAALWYAENIIHGRWFAAGRYIKQDEDDWERYKRYIDTMKEVENETK